jgi:ribosome biogenesis GTPase
MQSNLKSYGWTAFWDAKFTSYLSQGLVPGRIVSEQRDSWAVMLESGERVGVLAGKLRVDESFPAVGDWVGVHDPGEGIVRIDALLSRRSCLARKEAGQRLREQVICANVDQVLLVTSLNADFNIRRIERYLAAIHASGAQALLVLSKLDAAVEQAAMQREVAEVAPNVPWVALSALSGEGLAELQGHLVPQQTFVLVGSSGVGKSTLVNRLLGREEQEVKDIRGDDAKGRHTTTGRHLFVLAGGALLVDTPGMRELQLWDDSSAGLDETFQDVTKWMNRCRYGDCRHSNEPGCALQEALASGALTEERYASFLKLERELDFLKRKKSKGARREEQRLWRQRSVDMRARRKLEGR